MWSLAIFFSTLSLTLSMFIGVEVPGLEPADSQGHLPGQGQTAEVDCTTFPPFWDKLEIYRLQSSGPEAVGLDEEMHSCLL